MNQSETPTSTLAPKKERLMSIDALRGFDMLWIVGGESVVLALTKWVGGPSGFVGTQLEHVDWEGFHFEDLIMPLFMFLAGVSLPFSLASREAKDPSRLRLWGHLLKRVALLWVFGMAVQGNLFSWDPAAWQYYSNTLQAIAAGYLIAMVLCMYCSNRAQWIITICLLLVTWIIFAKVAAPGGRANDYSPDGNIGIWLDKFMLRSHQDGTPYVWILGSLNFGVTTMMGVFAGRCLRNQNMTGNRKALWLAGSGAMAIGLAFAWAPFHPIIKHLWTGSFVLLSGGMCLLLLALFYWIIDVRGWKKWSYFLVVIGANAIAAYMLSHIWNIGGVLGGHVFGHIGHWLPGDLADLIRTGASFGALWLILWHFYRHRIFLKV